MDDSSSSKAAVNVYYRLQTTTLPVDIPVLGIISKEANKHFSVSLKYVKLKKKSLS